MASYLRSHAEWFLLAAILLVAAGLRFSSLTGPSLTSDEVIDLDISGRALEQIWKSADGFPPLHYFLTHVALRAGWGDNSARILAALAGVGSVYFGYRLGNLLFGTRTALFAAGWFTIWPTAVYYSREGRAYSLYLLVATVGIWLAFRAMGSNRRGDWLIFALAAGVGSFAHYYLGFLWLALAVIWQMRVKRGLPVKNGIIGWVLLGMLMLPLLNALTYDLSENQVFLNRADFGLGTVVFSGWALLTGFCLGPSLAELHTLVLSEAIQEIVLWIPLVLGGSLILLRELFRKGGNHEAELAILLFVPTGLALLTTPLIGIAYNVRYIVASLVPLLVLTARGLTIPPWERWRVVAAVLLIITCGVSNANRFWSAGHQNEDSRAAARFLERQTDHFPVLCMSHYMTEPLEHYHPGERRVIPVESVADTGENLAEVIDSIKRVVGKQGKFWLFYSRAYHGDPEGMLLKSLLSENVIEERGSWPGVRLFQGVFPSK